MCRENQKPKYGHLVHLTWQLLQHWFCNSFNSCLNRYMVYLYYTSTCSSQTDTFPTRKMKGVMLYFLQICFYNKNVEWKNKTFNVKGKWKCLIFYHRKKVREVIERCYTRIWNHSKINSWLAEVQRSFLQYLHSECLKCSPTQRAHSSWISME